MPIKHSVLNSVPQRGLNAYSIGGAHRTEVICAIQHRDCRDDILWLLQMPFRESVFVAITNSNRKDLIWIQWSSSQGAEHVCSKLVSVGYKNVTKLAFIGMIIP